MTLEDETAIANVIVWPKMFETYRPIVLGTRLVSVTGQLQNEQGVIHIVAEHLEDLAPLLRRLSDHTEQPIHSRVRMRSSARARRARPGTRDARSLASSSKSRR